MYTYVWILVYFAVYLTSTESLSMVHSKYERKFNLPDDPQSTSADNQPGRKVRQATGSGTPAETCICVPTGSCSSTTTPPAAGPDGSGVIDIRIASNGAPSPPVSSLPGPPSPAPTLPGPQSQGPSITSCSAGLVLCCQPGPYQCGVRYPPVAGAPVADLAASQAPFGSYPWQAILSYNNNYYGSGVLLNNLHVLTAAHRVVRFVNDASPLKIRLGEWNLGADTEPIPFREFPVSKVFSHPNFNAENLKNDVSIVRLAEPVPLGTTPTITAGCLPTLSFAGARCYVSGWGRNTFVNGTFQSIQKHVDVPILQSTQCQSALRATKLGSEFAFDAASFICAGGEAGKDACVGDGGSPLMCAIGNRWFVAGLVAWGIGCGTINVPGVYVNVATFVPWIQTTINS